MGSPQKCHGNKQCMLIRSTVKLPSWRLTWSVIVITQQLLQVHPVVTEAISFRTVLLGLFGSFAVKYVILKMKSIPGYCQLLTQWQHILPQLILAYMIPLLAVPLNSGDVSKSWIIIFLRMHKQPFLLNVKPKLRENASSCSICHVTALSCSCGEKQYLIGSKNVHRKKPAGGKKLI